MKSSVQSDSEQILPRKGDGTPFDTAQLNHNNSDLQAQSYAAVHEAAFGKLADEIGFREGMGLEMLNDPPAVPPMEGMTEPIGSSTPSGDNRRGDLGRHGGSSNPNDGKGKF